MTMDNASASPPAALSEQLLRQLLAGDDDPEQLARAHNLSLSALARWAGTGEAAHLLRGVLRLTDARTQMLICRYRANAAARLIDMATNQEPSELSRKACVDLLRTELKIIDRDLADEAKPSESPAAPDERAVLAALEKLGEEGQLEDEHEHDRRG